jgi:hypothetical protein
MFHNIVSFYGEEFSAPCPSPKLEDHPSSVVRDYLFNTFAATLHIGGGGARSSIRNLRTHHAMLTGNHLYRLIGLKKYPSNQLTSGFREKRSDSQMAHHT